MSIDIFKDLGIGGGGKGLKPADKARLVRIANTAQDLSTPIMTDLANVVGSPAAATDNKETAIVNIQNAKNTLATNLSSYGVTANGVTDSLAGLATKAGTIPRQGADTQAAKVIPLTNLIYNGNFANGTSGWTPQGSPTVSVANNILNVTATAAGNGICQSYGARTNRVIYACLMHKSYTNVSTYLNVYETTTGTNIDHAITLSNQTDLKFSSMRFTTSPNNTGLTATIVNWNASGWGLVQASKICLIDLTAAFGAGNEPTQAQMDSIINTLGNWFEGTAVIEKIPTGYYGANGISGGPEVFTTSAGLKSGNILSGINILGVVGDIPNYAGGNIDTNSSATDGYGNLYFYPSVSAYVTPATTIHKKDDNFIASNILSGKSIFGIAGTAVSGKRWAEGNITVTKGEYTGWINPTYTGLFPFTPSTLLIKVGYVTMGRINGSGFADGYENDSTGSIQAVSNGGFTFQVSFYGGDPNYNKTSVDIYYYAIE